VLTTRLIPCLDCDGGRVVKGRRFRDLRDCGDAVDLAARYAADGADELTLLDVSATVEGRGHALMTTAAVRAVCDVPLCVGGGVKSVQDARQLLQRGADKVAVNSAAISNPTLLQRLADAFGNQAVVLAVDAQREPDGDYFVKTHSGRRTTRLQAIDWIHAAADHGAGEVLLTSVDRDGTGEGYDLELLRRARAATDLPLIASGGAHSIAHLSKAAAAGSDALLVASILHDQFTTIPRLKRALAATDLPIRESHT